MLSSVIVPVIVPAIVSTFVLVTGDLVGRSVRPQWRLQPAKATTKYDSAYGRTRLDSIRFSVWLAASNYGNEQSSTGRNQPSELVASSLRAVGILRRTVERPVVGPKAYVRLWQRLRSLIVLGAIVVGLGIAVAVVIGVIVVGLAFLLENAIS